MAIPERNTTGHTVVKDETDVRAGSKEGVVRYVLVIGLGLAVLAMIGVYFVV